MDIRDGSFNKNKYLIDNFDKAIKEEWIEVYCQPIIRTSNGKVCGDESLVRWEDPQLGLLNPMEFVPTLEAVDLIHKLDLFVLEKTLDKIKEQRRRGFYVVPNSINFSKSDFYSCDLVDEVLKRVDAAGVPHRMIAIAITEGAINYADDFVVEQIRQFQELGFQIWMDDYGNGDSAPALLQRLRFDILKINRFYVSQILYSKSARIILTELVRMAMALGMETVAEGVECEEQIEFLKEIGCTKAQGFYFRKPLPIPAIFDRYSKGKGIGAEDPRETEYYSAIGKINLYDLAFTRPASGEVESYFDTLPCAIVESDGDTIRIIRGNKSFKEFMNQNFVVENMDSVYDFKDTTNTVGNYTMNLIRKCGEDGKRTLIDDRLIDGRTVHILLQRIAVNPVKNLSAVAIVIISVSEKSTMLDSLTYNYIARVLSEDYINLFYVNMDTGEYVEYKPDPDNQNVSEGLRGDDFFKKAVSKYFNDIYEEDLDRVRRDLTKNKIEDAVKKNGVYVIDYRRIIDGEPRYVNLKAVKVRGDGNFIIIGIVNVDDQVKQHEFLEGVKEEKRMYTRIMSLTGDFVCVYSVDLESEKYSCFSSTKEYDKLDITKDGNDFFNQAVKDIKNVIVKEDLNWFLINFTKEKILGEIEKKGLFAIRYRLKIKDKPIYVSMRATIVEEESQKKLIVGVLNIDNQVNREREFEETLSAVEDEARQDQLTGVKNKRAYGDIEDLLNRRIKDSKNLKFAVVVCDLNDLKQINDEKGHNAGDEYIKEGCKIICNVFAHSPVYRIGGDEFAIIAQDSDYTSLDLHIEEINKINIKNSKSDKVTIAVGAAVYEDDHYVSEVFERADTAMYNHKREMKENKKM
ncbi:MAG: GGDEF domain-containing protein [Pseudobutyrivibrio sp.]|nr:GGDEF domain-containing protein [Pseudobutyrivibrio sp.]